MLVGRRSRRIARGRLDRTAACSRIARPSRAWPSAKPIERRSRCSLQTIETADVLAARPSALFASPNAPPPSLSTSAAWPALPAPARWEAALVSRSARLVSARHSVDLPRAAVAPSLQTPRLASATSSAGKRKPCASSWRDRVLVAHAQNHRRPVRVRAIRCTRSRAERGAPPARSTPYAVVHAQRVCRLPCACVSSHPMPSHGRRIVPGRLDVARQENRTACRIDFDRRGHEILVAELVCVTVAPERTPPSSSRPQREIGAPWGNWGLKSCSTLSFQLVS